MKVPELCSIHPFNASLWRQAVCLPCILYRLNCLLIANNIRLTVATQISGLGQITLQKGFKWEGLSFGWSLSDVLANLSQTGNKSELLDGDSSRDVTKEEEIVEEVFVDKLPEEEPKKKERVKSKSAKKIEKEAEEELTGFAKAAKEATLSGVSLAEALLLNENLLG